MLNIPGHSLLDKILIRFAEYGVLQSASSFVGDVVE
jgi:hypothetical protein